MNYDNKEYQVKDFKEKYFLTICLTIYATKVDSASYMLIKHYENYAKTNKNYVFVIVLYDHIRSEFPDGINRQFELYEKITKNINIKADNLFFTFEGGDSRRFSAASILNNLRVPTYQTFYINKEGNPCHYNLDKDTPCYSDETHKIFNSIKKKSEEITDHKDFDFLFK